jgi:hypothetical protein
MEAYLQAELGPLNITRSRFIKLWLEGNSSIGRSNTWNNYEEYFKDHTEQELARLADDAKIDRKCAVNFPLRNLTVI